MRVNTAKSIKLGESIYEEFGSWKKARDAAELKDGVYVLPPKVAKPATKTGGDR
jgi:hypothetical protein